MAATDAGAQRHAPRAAQPASQLKLPGRLPVEIKTLPRPNSAIFKLNAKTWMKRSTRPKLLWLLRSSLRKTSSETRPTKRSFALRISAARLRSRVRLSHDAFAQVQVVTAARTFLESLRVFHVYLRCLLRAQCATCQCARRCALIDGHLSSD